MRFQAATMAACELWPRPNGLEGFTLRKLEFFTTCQGESIRFAFKRHRQVVAFQTEPHAVIATWTPFYHFHLDV